MKVLMSDPLQGCFEREFSFESFGPGPCQTDARGDNYEQLPHPSQYLCLLIQPAGLDQSKVLSRAFEVRDLMD